MVEKRFAIILAAGQGTRMKSKLFKVMHPVMGKPMVEHVVGVAKSAGIDRVVTVTGVGAEVVQEHLGDASDYAFQKEQLGTAHAVMEASSILEHEEGTTVVLAGDTPLLTAETLEKLLSFHEKEGASATVLTAIADDPSGYGRVIRNDGGAVAKVVEDKDATDAEKAVNEINTGTYCFDNQKLFKALKKVDNNNAQGEYYLPDVIKILREEGDLISAYVLEDMSEALGVNDRVNLSIASRYMKKRINEMHMRNGVTIVDPDNTYIETDVKIGSDTVIEPGVYLKGNTVIGEHCLIGANSEIIDSTLGDHVKVRHSVLEESVVGKHSDIGPYGRLRKGSEIKEHVHLGNYVEVKNSVIDDYSQAGHHAYIGDADIGKKVNVGCGVIFANYDGHKKHRSTIGDHVFLGSNATIVSPVTVGDHAFIAAGSTINEDVPAESLGIARQRQTNKEGYMKKQMERS